MMKDAKNPTSIGEKPTPLFADPCMSSDHAISLYRSGSRRALLCGAENPGSKTKHNRYKLEMKTK